MPSWYKNTEKLRLFVVFPKIFLFFKNSERLRVFRNTENIRKKHESTERLRFFAVAWKTPKNWGLSSAWISIKAQCFKCFEKHKKALTPVVLIQDYSSIFKKIKPLPQSRQWFKSKVTFCDFRKYNNTLIISFLLNLAAPVLINQKSELKKPRKTHLPFLLKNPLY